MALFSPFLGVFDILSLFNCPKRKQKKILAKKLTAKERGGIMAGEVLMSKPRPLDYNELQRMRNQGMTWKAIADELHWSAASLRDRLNRDGWYEQAPAPPSTATPPPSTAKKKGSLKEQVYVWLKAGIEPETAAAALGKTLPALAMCCRCDLGELKAKARAEAAVEIAQAIYERALSGDRAALSQYRRSLA